MYTTRGQKNPEHAPPLVSQHDRSSDSKGMMRSKQSPMLFPNFTLVFPRKTLSSSTRHAWMWRRDKHSLNTTAAVPRWLQTRAHLFAAVKRNHEESSRFGFASTGTDRRPKHARTKTKCSSHSQSV